MRRLPLSPRGRHFRGRARARQMLRLPRAAHGHIRAREALHRRLCDAQPRDSLAGLCAPARECLFLARRPYQTCASGLPAMPLRAGRERYAGPRPCEPHQRLQRIARFSEYGCLRGLPSPERRSQQLPGLPQVRDVMGFTRRDLLTFTGGSAAGLLFTPVPWSLLRDTAVLSENWPGVPQPLHGEIRTRYTNCTLCPAGCGVRARCVGDRPVSLVGVSGHPASRGVLCPAGLVGHHLAFCRNRAAEPLAGGKPVAIERALTGVSAAIAARGPRESVAILDPRPGRAASLVYRRFLAGLPRGVHCAPPNAEPYGAFGIDLENTRAILSFGAPVLDGWLSPGRVLANRSHFQLIQIEPAYSRTASLADLWVPVLPGSEDDFAAAVARALDGETTDAHAAEVARILLRNKSEEHTSE